MSTPRPRQHGAPADLAPRDSQIFCAAKELQLALEDELGLTEEHFVSGMRSFVGMTEPRLRAILCVEEGERAMREGETWKARFWLDRAQHYRARMDET